MLCGHTIAKVLFHPETFLPLIPPFLHLPSPPQVDSLIGKKQVRGVTLYLVKWSGDDYVSRPYYFRHRRNERVAELIRTLTIRPSIGGMDAAS